MPRYKTDLHSILKYGRLSQRHFLVIASQIIDILKHLHEKHYVHSDIKAENIMVGQCQVKVSPNKTQAFAENTYKPAKVRRNNEHSSDFFSNNTRGSHNLRPTRKVAYISDENSSSSNCPESIKNDDCDEDFEKDEDFDFSPKKKNSRKSPKKMKNIKCGNTAKEVKEKHSKFLYDENDDERVFVIDYGLATKFVNINEDKIVHKPFCCDERRAHDGTLEFTSRDAHFGAHSRRSDLECFG